MKQEMMFGGSGYNNEGMKDLYTRVTEDAIKILNGMESISPEIKRKAILLMQNTEFRRQVKARWDEDTLRGVVDSDPEEQEKKWAKGLAQRVLSDASAEQSL